MDTIRPTHHTHFPFRTLLFGFFCFTVGIFTIYYYYQSNLLVHFIVFIISILALYTVTPCSRHSIRENPHVIVPVESSDTCIEEDLERENLTKNELEIERVEEENQETENGVEALDSCSDDESLIEIDLPDGNYIGSKDIVMGNCEESLLRAQGLMEFLSEFVEDNLIEIDISMGSIKCSRFDFKP
ncbi:uncharacterized protein LOC110008275 [Amborella trichopoda]|uniref:uncharacterized protein LOC110008275 n=1 Tax=Amborella trichopoda TaxID=13333 RepID=UPI0009BF7FCB|nr:uncharacterized protein LOC110008275 [Amborella trichopoda]|eukprot:XP_020530501.1 uncharacterized protein LOC110008275 [Amborella trichopoda]